MAHPNRTVSLVLGSGGARGLAHIGVVITSYSIHYTKLYDELMNAAGQRRRDAMIEAAYSLFIEKGYASYNFV